MKEHIIRTWCDACLGDEAELTRNEGWTHTVMVDGAKAEIDLCETHTKSLLGPLAALMEDRGVPLKQPKSAPARAETAGTGCPLCGAEVQPHSVAGHIWTTHAGGRQPQPETCPECGASFGHDPRSMGAHRAKAHGMQAVKLALAAAREREAALAGRRAAG